MAVKNSSYEKFKAIQMNNEEIAQQDFAGMRRSSEGWHLTGPAANSILGGQPLLKAGGTGAKILDIAANEPKPKTTGQAILKAAGQWKPLNDFYKKGVAAAPGNQPASTKNTIADLTAQKRAQAETSQTTDQRAQPQTTPGTSSVEATAAAAGTTSAAKTYTVNGSQMTLGEYIKSLGTDPNAAYRQNVAAANAAYDRQRATYGAEAEALAGQGLAGSGTSDYMDAQAYAAKQKAISQAATARDQQMTEIAGQHMSYLQQEKAAQDAKIQTALERAASMQLNTSNTVKYLMAMTGMTKSEAERYAEGNAALVAEEDNTQATLQEITQTYLTLMKSAENGGMGMSSEAARQYLKSGTYSYDTALVDQAVNNLVGAQEQAKADELAQTQKAVSDVFDKSISVWDGATAQAKLAELGITVTPNEKDGAIPLRDMRNALVAAYNNQMINEDQYLSLMKSEAAAAIDSGVDVKDLASTLQVAVDTNSDKDVFNFATEKMADAITVKKNLNAKAGDLMESALSLTTTATFGIGVDGKANHEVVLNLGGTKKDGVNADENSLYVDEKGDLYAYARYKNGGEWRKVIGVKASAGLTKEQKQVLLQALKQKYKKQ